MSKRFKILVVDDEPINIKVIDSALKYEYEIIVALNGSDAICKVKEDLPDMVILDVMMPGISGFEVCSNLKADPSFSDIPIIFLTAMDTFDGEVRGLECGGIDYLTKPVNIELLRLRVRNHITLKERNDLVKEQRDLLAKQKEELETAISRIKKLEGILPICMYCKSIRTDTNSWQQLEMYISEHSDALFSHGICEKCMEKHYPDIATKIADRHK